MIHSEVSVAESLKNGGKEILKLLGSSALYVFAILFAVATADDLMHGSGMFGSFLDEAEAEPTNQVNFLELGHGGIGALFTAFFVLKARKLSN